jgi:rod shape-determining protein MreD
VIRTAAYAGLAAAAAVLQTTWLADFRPEGAGVDPLLLVVMSVALTRGAEAGMVVGAGAGLLQDVMNGVPIGLGVAANVCAGFCAGLGEGRLYLEDRWLPAVAAFVVTIVRNAVWLGLGHLIGLVSVAPFGAARMVLLSACYNGLVAVPVFYWFRRLDRTLERLSRRPG